MEVFHAGGDLGGLIAVWRLGRWVPWCGASFFFFFDILCLFCEWGGRKGCLFFTRVGNKNRGGGESRGIFLANHHKPPFPQLLLLFLLLLLP